MAGKLQHFTKGHYSGIGGQAVLEGVMMKNRNMYAVAVRRPDHEIEVEVAEYHGILEKSIVTKIPFIRGIFVFLDSLILGMRVTNWSAGFYEEEEAEPTKLDRALDKVFRGNAEKVVEVITMLIGFLIAIALFVLIPYFAADFLSTYLRSRSLLALIEGLLRLIIFIIYIILISKMKDIERLFQYHGAEHKCISCIETGLPLTVENVRKSSRYHKRCGTSFLVLVMIISIILFFFVHVDSRVLRLLLRFVMIPVIAGISYEVIHYAGNNENLLVDILSAPGVAFQRITTKEPDDEMIEVGIASVEAVFDWKKFEKKEFGPQEDIQAD